MVQLSNSERLFHSPFFQNYFCLIEKYQVAFVCISKNASTYLKNISIYTKEGDMQLSENEIHNRVGYSPQNGYLIPVSEISRYEDTYGKLLKFAVWRDPVERLISSYKWFLLEKNWRVYFNWLSLYEDKSFERFLTFVEFELGKSNPKMQDEHIRRQVDYYNVLDVDYIIHIDELNDFLVQNGIPILDNKNNQTRKDKVVITPSQINKIKKMYRDDYSLLNHVKSTMNNVSFVQVAPEDKFMNDSFSDTIGMCGNMGKVISLFSMYRKTKVKDWERQAENLLDDIMEKCNREAPLSYGNGLCGVGFGIEYLLQNHFIKGNADEILSDIDAIIFNEINVRTLSGLSIDNGISGLGYYLYYRLHYRKTSEEIIALNLKRNIIYLIDWIEEAVVKDPIRSNFYEVFFVLTLLHNLDIFNAKVEKLQNIVKGLLTFESSHESY